MKIYEWFGEGLALGSSVTVIAESEEQAVNLVKREVLRMGLGEKNMDLWEDGFIQDNINVEDFKPPCVVTSWDGDY